MAHGIITGQATGITHTSQRCNQLFRYLYPATGNQPDSTDELVKGTCVTRDGNIVHELLQSLVREEVSR